MSIAKAQARAIADGFLDHVGSGSSKDLQARETFTEIILIASELIEDAQANLIKSNSNASGKLSASLVAQNPVLENQVFRVKVMMNFYGLFVNKGVKGTRGGSSLNNYSFKSDNPPPSFVDAIDAWKTRGAMSTSNSDVKKTYGANEAKNKSIGDIGSAYAIARSIMQKGIEATGFMDNACDKTRQRIKSRIGSAIKVDILTSLIQKT